MTASDGEDNRRISPGELLSLMGYSPADNIEDYETTIHWKSKLAGGQVRALFQWEKILESMSESPEVLGPLALTADFQKSFLEAFFTGPVRSQAKTAAQMHQNPDLFARLNERIEQAYAARLRDLCGVFMKDGRFDRDLAREISSTPEGKTLLRSRIPEFAWLEYGYNSLGLTRLKAMKELLQSLLMLVTEQPLQNGKELPCMRLDSEGNPACPFTEYLDEIQTRLENLHLEDAFDIKAFSEKATGGRIGYSPYEIVPGSRFHSATLRHYPLSEGTQPNGDVLYMVTPLINKPEIFDLAQGKSVIEAMLRHGYAVYLVDHGEPGPEDADLGLDFYGKHLHDRYLELLHERHPGQNIFIMAYCMGGTLILPYLARRAQERWARGQSMDIRHVVLMASPVKFDDGDSGHGPIRKVIRESYDPMLMRELFGDVNIPPQVIDAGMQEIQPGVQYTVASGFYGRSLYRKAIRESGPFLYWLLHGTRFPARAHEEWIRRIFMENQIYEGTYRLPSSVPELDGRPVDMGALSEACVALFDYRGERDPISPPGSCVATELWGKKEDGNCDTTRGELNRTIERNIGHIFVVSKRLLGDYLERVLTFFQNGREEMEGKSGA